MVGTVKWSIEDDEGKIHDIILPNTLYSAQARNRLLSPQHWSQQAVDHYPKPNGTWCATYSDKIKLFWDQQQYVRTVYLSPRSNVGVLRSAPNTQSFAKACIKIEKDADVIAMPTVLEEDNNYEETEEATEPPHFISESEGEEEENESRGTPREANSREKDDLHAMQKEERESTVRSDKPLALDLLFSENADQDPPSFTFSSAQEEYMHWHIKLGHLSHKRIQQLATQKKLPLRLSKIQPPLCPACIHGKATKKPWRTRAEVKKAPKVVTKPGECVAVDQLESTTPGFVGQLKGSILTTMRYRYATIFVDMYSDYTFVYMHTKLTAEETVKAKEAFEKHAQSHGVNILQYHADNGRFQDVAFKQSCEDKRQVLTFCGVNAHFQNGRAEKKIRDLQDATRTSLLHAMRKWSKVININLWPYAMRYAADVHNAIPSKGHTKSPLELFSGIEYKIPFRQFHHFGCPTYVLDADLQAGKRSGSKWKDRARLGVNLGFSPQHARSVHLILSLTTGCVSPQYHCTFDDHFTTLKEYDLPKSSWQEKAHFIIPKRTKQEIEADRFKNTLPNEGATIPPAARQLQELNPQGDNYERESHTTGVVSRTI